MTIYSPEIFPTKIRNITFSYSSFTGRITPMLVPILTKLMPQIIDYTFLFSGVISGFLGVTLEETLGKKLLDIIPEEIEEYKNNLINKLSESWNNFIWNPFEWYIIYVILGKNKIIFILMSNDIFYLN